MVCSARALGGPRHSRAWFGSAMCSGSRWHDTSQTSARGKPKAKRAEKSKATKTKEKKGGIKPDFKNKQDKSKTHKNKSRYNENVMEIRDKQNFILGCENEAPAWKELISRHHPLAALRLAINEMQVVQEASAQLRPSLGWGGLHRRSTEDRAAGPTAEEVHPIGRFGPHRGVGLSARRRRPAEGDFWPMRRLLPTIVAGNGSFGSWFGRCSHRLEVPETPQNSIQRLSFEKKTWNQKLHCVSHPSFSLWMVNFRSWLGWFVSKCDVQFCPLTFPPQHTSSLTNEIPREFLRQTFSLGKPSHTCAYRLRFGLLKPGSEKIGRAILSKTPSKCLQ